MNSGRCERHLMSDSAEKVAKRIPQPNVQRYSSGHKLKVVDTVGKVFINRRTEHIWTTMEKKQKIYDPFSNEWDCCYEFGELSSDETAMDDDDDYDDEYPLMPPLSAAVADQASSFNAPLTDPLVPTVEPTPASASQHTPTVEAR